MGVGLTYDFRHGESDGSRETERTNVSSEAKRSSLLESVPTAGVLVEMSLWFALLMVDK
jgi:hypothetical protein